MIFYIKKRPPKPEQPESEWKTRFAWWPIRVGENKIIWMESYLYKFVLLDTWDDFYFRYKYQYYHRHEVWDGPEELLYGLCV